MSVLIIGGGEIGRFIAEKLIEEKKEVIIIEKNERLIDELEEDLDAKIILGNGAAPHVLRDAGIAGVNMVIAVTNSDEVNLLVTLLASLQAPQAKRIARIRDPQFDIEGETIQDQLKVNLVINPDKESANAILKILEVPGALDIIDFFDGRLKLVGTKVRRNSEVVNRPLSDLTEFSDGGACLLAAIVRGGQLLIPTGESRIMPGDAVYFAAEVSRVAQSMRLFGHEMEKPSSVMISGGGFIGMHLAASLEKLGVGVKIVEDDPKLCSILSRNLNKPIILNASASDQELLQEENIDRMDAFVAVTKDDEENILSGLLAKKMGCPMAISLSHKRAYSRLIYSLGVDVVINPRQLASDTILHFIRKGKVLHAISIMDEAELIEVEALPTSDIVTKPISELKLPKGLIILSLKRGDEIMVPRGQTVIQPGDRALIIARQDAIAKFEKMITVRLEYF